MRTLLLAFAASAVAAPALASDPPPQGAKALSEILVTVEARDDFAFIEEVEFEDRAYEIEYNTKDDDEKKVNIDPMTGDVTDD